MKKITIGIIICVLMISRLMAQIAEPPAIGDGSSANPYQISTLENLYWLSQSTSEWINKHFIQVSDIDATGTATWNPDGTGGYYGWSPIGNTSTPFIGSFNGQGYTITGLYINRKDINGQGFFGSVSETSIENVKLASVSITGYSTVGALAAEIALNSVVANCNVTGSVKGRSYYLGGLVGNCIASEIKNSFTSCNVSPYNTNSYPNFVGGVVGGISNGSLVENCYSLGYTEGWSFIGGLMGNCLYSTVKTSFSKGNVKSREYAGGMIGATDESNISNCFSFSNVNSYSGLSGGFIGRAVNSAVNYCFSTGSATAGGGMIQLNSSTSVNNSFWDSETSGCISSNGGIKKTSAQMKNFLTYLDAGWDFMQETTNGTNDIWGINPTENNGYPFISYMGYDFIAAPAVTTQAVTNITPTTAVGNGTIVHMGSSNVIQHGVCWSTTPNPTINNNKTGNGPLANPGAFTSAINGLSLNVTYYVRAYATNNEGTAYGEQVQFTPALEGEGTIANPYHIASLSDLLFVYNNSSFWDKHFIQIADIDATETSTWNSGSGWAAIGSTTTPFTGSYNGLNHTINGVYMNRQYNDRQGLFGTVNSATLKNLNLTNVDITGYSFVGALAGFCDASSIVDNCSTSGTVKGSQQRLGGLVGSVSASIIKNSHSVCNVTRVGASTTYLVGGLVGFIGNGSTIENCSASGIVSAYSDLGGLVGAAENSTVRSSFSSSTVTASNYGSGGLMGRCDGSIVTNCFSMGNVSAQSYCAGLISIVGASSTISNCYSRSVVGFPSGYGGLIYSNSSYSATTNCFWDKQVSGQSSSYGGTGKNTIEMQDYSLYITSGWDFMAESTNGTDDVWGINPTENGGYPFLAWQGYTYVAPPTLSTQAVTDITITTAVANGTILALGSSSPTQHGFCWSTTENPTVENSKTEEGAIATEGVFTSSLSGLTHNTTYYVRAYATNTEGTGYGNQVQFTTPMAGDGTEGNPFQIASFNDLLWIYSNSGNWNKFFIQTADIDASASATLNSGDGWMPIGSLYGIKFSGTYDGQEHTITGLYIHRSNDDGMALFGVTQSATIKNVKLVGFNITGRERSAALAGRVEQYTNILNCSVTGTVSGKNYVGGLVGFNNQSFVEKCSSSASVSAIEYVGGLVGYQNNGLLSESICLGTVTGLEKIGGLVGALSNSTVSNSYATGNVNSVRMAGGLIGYLMSGTITHCYSTGVATGGTYVGGAIGYYSDATVNSCFWDMESSGNTSGTGNATVPGITGQTTTQMQNQSTFSDASWDFTTVWAISPRSNGGYPYLQWQTIPQTPAVSVKSINNVTNNSFTVISAVIHLGDTDPIQHGICWNTSGNPTLANEKTEQGAASTVGLFTSNLTELAVNTTYYVRAYAINSFGTSFSEQVTVSTLPISVEQPVGDGSGSAPYEITNLANLLWVAQNQSSWGSNFIQTAHIDASATSTWFPNGTGGYFGWNPIGNPITNFTGNYYGQGHIISGLYISRANSNSIALFGYIKNATVQNLGLIDANITGNNEVGALTGTSYDADIMGCFSTGSVHGEYRVGGLVGYEYYYSTISNSYSACNTSTNLIAGGLVGTCEYSSVTNSYSRGSVSGPLNNGLIGYSSVGTITNSFWDTQTSGVSSSAGGTGKTTAEMTNYLTFKNASWDFKDETENGTADIWGYNPNENDGYPFLWWQGYPNDLPVPIVTTQPVDNIETTTATGHGTITDLGTPNPSQYGVCWSTLANPTIADAKTELGEAIVTGEFVSEISGLLPGTLYYVRAYATNDAGTCYGEQVEFTTIKQTQTISFDEIEPLIYGDASFELTATATSELEVSYTSSNPTVATVTGNVVTIVGAGFTTITASQMGNNFYFAADDVEHELTVNKKALTVTANSQTKVYGEENPELTVSYSEFVNGENIDVINEVPSVLCLANTFSNVGEYPIIVSGGFDNNYSFNHQNGVLTIDKRVLTLINFTADSKVYDGTVDVTGAGFDDDRINNDILSFTFDVAFEDKNIGEDKPVNYTNISIPVGTDNDNYVLALNTGTTVASIYAKELTIGGSFTVFDKEYDGTAIATIDQNDLTLNGTILLDDVVLNPVAEFTSASIGTDILVVLTDATIITGINSENYVLLLTGAPTTTASITEPYIPQFTLTINIVGSGLLLVNGVAYTAPIAVDEGTVLTIEAIADTDWQFDSWSGDLASTDAVETITMDTDKSITATFSIIDNVETNTLTNLKAYPNPFRNSITIDNAESVSTIIVTNLVGQKVLEMQVAGSGYITIPTEGLVNGVYFIIAQFENGERVVRKMVKE